MVNRVLKVLLGVLVGGGGCLWADISADVGQLQLSGSNGGYQTLTLLNLTGPSPDGCGANATYGSSYNVCTPVDLTVTSGTITYLDETNGGAQVTYNLPAANYPATVNPSPDGVTAVPTFLPEASVPFDITFTGCSPTCDAYITNVTLNGTFGAGPTILQVVNPVNSLNTVSLYTSGTFSVSWNVPLNDYTGGNPNGNDANAYDGIYDQTDIIVHSALTPEPGYLIPVLIGGIALISAKRASSLRAAK